MESALLFSQLRPTLFYRIIYQTISLFLFLSCTEIMAQANTYLPAKKVASEFKTLLERPTTELRPSFQSFKTDSVWIEKGFIYSEATEKVPILIYKPITSSMTRLPAVICLHGTGGNKEEESIKKILYRLSKMGMMAVSIDARYHGERISGGAHTKEEYVEAIIKAWKNTDSKEPQHPLYFDTVYDLWRLTDYLITRQDVNPKRIGMMGISMGGIQTWMAASVDKRIKVAVPLIAVQSFKWSLENDRWQGRAQTIWAVHQQAAKDLGDAEVNKENVQAVWNKLLPSILDKFDCPSMIRLFAPRPLLLLNAEKDMNCPLPGAKIAFDAATQAYRSKKSRDKLMIHVTPQETHHLIPEHVEMAVNWFSKWL